MLRSRSAPKAREGAAASGKDRQACTPPCIGHAGRLTREAHAPCCCEPRAWKQKSNIMHPSPVACCCRPVPSCRPAAATCVLAYFAHR
jgi:hypothetical protein